MKDNKMKYSNLHHGDVVLVNYGNARDGRMTRGIKPSLIISSEASIEKERYVYVVPLYRRVTSFHKTDSILVRKNRKNGLRYDEYIQPMFLQRIHKGRISEVLGSLDDSKLMNDIGSSVGSMFDISGKEAMKDE